MMKFQTKESHLLQVLVVDDDPMQLEYISLLLHSLNIENIVTAGEGREAVNELEKNQHSFDLIICDIVMPTMDGYDFLAYLGAHQIAIPLIIISAQNAQVLRGAGLVAQLRLLSLIGELEKPVAPEKFVSIVKQLLVN